MKLLLHTCCAPCSISCIEMLRSEGIEPTLFWYNPNIHPYQEYKSRRDTLIAYAQQIQATLILDEDYGLRNFVSHVAQDISHRCTYCYAVRLEETARYAAEHGFSHICTTLFVSPYQNHELLRETGERMAQQYGVELLYRDFRPGFRVGQAKARELELYCQKYCGCVFSEEDRYQKPIQKVQGTVTILPARVEG